MEKIKTNYIAMSGIIVAVYFILTHALSFMSFGVIQIRLSEIISLLPFYNKKYIIPCMLAVLTTNMFSPLGMTDVIFGELCCISYLIAYKLNIEAGYKTALLFSVICGLIIGIELKIVFGTPFIMNIVSVFIGQFISCVLIGAPMIKTLIKKKVI